MEVRRQAAHYLQDWVEDVPRETAARALLDETNRNTRRYNEQLLRVVLDHRQGARPAIDPVRPDEQLAAWREALRSQSSSVRVRALMRMPVPMNDREKAREVILQAVRMLKDPTRRVRQRAAYELWRWSADMPEGAVLEALRQETDERVKGSLEFLLKRVHEQRAP